SETSGISSSSGAERGGAPAPEMRGARKVPLSSGGSVSLRGRLWPGGRGGGTAGCAPVRTRPCASRGRGGGWTLCTLPVGGGRGGGASGPEASTRGWGVGRRGAAALRGRVSGRDGSARGGGAVTAGRSPLGRETAGRSPLGRETAGRSRSVRTGAGRPGSERSGTCRASDPSREAPPPIRGKAPLTVRAGGGEGATRGGSALFARRRWACSSSDGGGRAEPISSSSSAPGPRG